ncbi:hypothetical protein GCM10009682_35990 [Luedemannella flava]|uniref:Uncharacterized protein n=1 Tax=Luedemannella flava TaxID=349316 RepID=A0ABP4YK31_9ACTN
MGRQLMIWPALRMRRALVSRVLTRRGAVGLVAVATVLVATTVLSGRADAATACRTTLIDGTSLGSYAASQAGREYRHPRGSDHNSSSERHQMSPVRS